MLSPFASLRGNSAKHLAAQRERSFAALRMTSDPRVLPLLLVKNHHKMQKSAHGVEIPVQAGVGGAVMVML